MKFAGLLLSERKSPYSKRYEPRVLKSDLPHTWKIDEKKIKMFYHRHVQWSDVKKIGVLM